MPSFVECVRSVSNAETGKRVFNPENARKIKDVIMGVERLQPEKSYLKMGGVSTIMNPEGALSSDKQIVTLSEAYRANFLNLRHEMPRHYSPKEEKILESRFTEPLSPEEIKHLASISPLPKFNPQ